MVNNKIQAILLMGLIFVIIMGRAPEVLLLPSLQAEDGSHVFAYFFENRGAIHLIREKAGYVPLLANLMGYASVRLPIRMIPYGLTLMPLLVTLASYSLFFSRRYRVVVANDASRALICLLFALAPLGQFHLLAHTDYSIWTSLLMFILLACIPLPSGRITAAGWWLLMNLLVWSHPLSFIMLPVQVYFAVQDKSRRAWYAATSLNMILYNILGTKSGHVFAHQDALSMLVLLGNVAKETFVMQGDIAFRTVLGQPLFNWAKRNMSFLVCYVDILIMVLILLAVGRDTAWRRSVLVLVYLMLGITFLILLSRGLSLAELEAYAHGPRYVYLQSLGFIVLVVGSLSVLFSSKGEEKRSYRELLPVGYMILLMLLLHYYLLNTQYGHYFFYNVGHKSPYYYADPRNGVIIRDFFERVAEKVGGLDSTTQEKITAEKINDWPIEVTVGTATSNGACPSTKSLCRLVK